jgi:ADP-ribose pyrophosphatase YjhB (NUDIX family)
MTGQQIVHVWMLIVQDGAMLSGLRKNDQPPFAGRWALPGEVMREDESSSETLSRFAREQLGVAIASEEFDDTLYLQDGGAEHAINVFRVHLDGHPRFRESGPYAQMRWVAASEVDDPAAYPAPAQLREYLKAALERGAT